MSTNISHKTYLTVRAQHRELKPNIIQIIALKEKLFGRFGITSLKDFCAQVYVCPPSVHHYVFYANNHKRFYEKMREQNILNASVAYQGASVGYSVVMNKKNNTTLASGDLICINGTVNSF